MKKLLLILLCVPIIGIASFPIVENSKDKSVTLSFENDKIDKQSYPTNSSSVQGAMDSNMFWLCFLGGLFGICGLHRFYKGQTFLGILMLLTFGGVFIWQLIDLIRIVQGKMNGRKTWKFK